MRLLRASLAILAISCVALLSACFPNLGDVIGGGGSSSPASVSGKWSILLTSKNGSSNNVDLEANFSQSTGSISAAQAVILSNSPCDSGADFIEGTVSSNNVSFTLAFGGSHPTETFSGTVSSNGLSMAGSYRIPSGDCTASDSGSWVATKYGDSSATYSGPFTSGNNHGQFNVITIVQEDANNNLAVTASITGGACASLNLTGTAIGSVLLVNTADDSVSMLARATATTYANLEVAYEIIGGKSCGATDSGTGALTKTAVNVVRHSNADAQETSPLSPQTQSLFDKIRETRAAAANN